MNNALIPLIAGSGLAPTKSEYDAYLKNKKFQKHLKRAMRELKIASRYGEISLALTEEQLKQIDEARARGDVVHVTIDISSD